MAEQWQKNTSTFIARCEDSRNKIIKEILSGSGRELYQRHITAESATLPGAVVGIKGELYLGLMIKTAFQFHLHFFL